MRFYLEDIQAIYLIQKNSPCFQNRNFSKKNLKLTGLKQTIITTKMANGPMNVIVDITTIKKMWKYLYD